MDFLKKIFSEDDEQVVGLCAFKTSFTPTPIKVYDNVRNFTATKLVYSSPKQSKQYNIFAFANE